MAVNFKLKFTDCTLVVSKGATESQVIISSNCL